MNTAQRRLALFLLIVFFCFSHSGAISASGLDETGKIVNAAKADVFSYPVEHTGLLMPLEPILRVAKPNQLPWYKQLISAAVRFLIGFRSNSEFLDQLGLNEVGAEHGDISLIERYGASGFTYSCSSCHVGNLFGDRVIGLTRRFPVKPLHIGQDNSLGQVSLSLLKLNETGDIDRSEKYQSLHDEMRFASSKPAVWWNVKYKTRYLLDGSLAKGSPVKVNFLWNELGRGSDIGVLDKWFVDNSKRIDALEMYVKSLMAPSYFDYFDSTQFDIKAAQRGQVIFRKRCVACHGDYKKGWESEGQYRNLKDQLKTIQVSYPSPTPIVNVGTDERRYKAMAHLLKLNSLTISKEHGITFELSEGYVPPPLEGIWARWPYLHNNSIPNLCQLFTPPEKRDQNYYAADAIDRERDFDNECNGYYANDRVARQWKQEKYLFDVTRSGSSNIGHYDAIFRADNGEEYLTNNDKNDLIKFLQTL